MSWGFGSEALGRALLLSGGWSACPGTQAWAAVGMQPALGLDGLIPACPEPALLSGQQGPSGSSLPGVSGCPLRTSRPCHSGCGVWSPQTLGAARRPLFCLQEAGVPVCPLPSPDAGSGCCLCLQAGVCASSPLRGPHLSPVCPPGHDVDGEDHAGPDLPHHFHVLGGWLQQQHLQRLQGQAD